MSTTGRTADGAADAERVVAAIREAGFVRVVSHADGAGLAAAGVLARGLDDAGVPFQVSLASTDASAASTLTNAAAESATLAFGFSADALGARDVDATTDYASGDATSVRDAADISRSLGSTPFEPLVLAGVLAAGEVPTEDDGGLSRRPGVGVPTDDLGDGLAHSTLLHGTFSGDENRAGATLAELGLPADLDDAAYRRLASVIAIEATSGGTPDRTSTALQHVLKPHVHADCEFATVEGYADVLDALARTAPGLGVATAVGRLDRTIALDAWRATAQSVHRTITRAKADVTPDESEETPHVASTVVESAAPGTVARLLRDFVAPSPNVLVTGEAGVALATTNADARDTLVSADAAGVGGHESLAYGTVDEIEELDALAARVRGVL